MDVRHKRKEWRDELMKACTKSDLVDRLLLAYVTIQNLEEKQERMRQITNTPTKGKQ